MDNYKEFLSLICFASGSGALTGLALRQIRLKFAIAVELEDPLLSLLDLELDVTLESRN